MLKKIRQFAKKEKIGKASAFSDFFTKCSTAEQKKVLDRALDQANKDQNAILRHSRKECYGNS